MSYENVQPDFRDESSSDWTPPQTPILDHHSHYADPMGYEPHMPMNAHTGYTYVHSHMTVRNLLYTVQSCASMCDHTISRLLCKLDVAMRFKQIQNLRDCAGICNETACSLAAGSPFSREFVNFCAKICELCGRECLRHSDPESQSCGHMCLRCAEECRIFVGAYYH